MSVAVTVRWTPCSSSTAIFTRFFTPSLSSSAVTFSGDFAGKIASGELAPDRPIPSENHLAEEYGVARLTARRTAQELRERALIVTVRGKGSFVVEQPVGEAPEEGEPNV
ncbi:GntR family transcriptional regulator [Streptomyces sp. VNUA24]|uniref:GntR family transcriptional regulator n=1 Tax=Streptomyces sp. VNUA24 TaxID=3031131 RepID=UPI0031BA4059